MGIISATPCTSSLPWYNSSSPEVILFCLDCIQWVLRYTNAKRLYLLILTTVWMTLMVPYNVWRFRLHLLVIVLIFRKGVRPASFGNSQLSPSGIITFLNEYLSTFRVKFNKLNYLSLVSVFLSLRDSLLWDGSVSPKLNPLPLRGHEAGSIRYSTILKFIIIKFPIFSFFSKDNKPLENNNSIKEIKLEEWKFITFYS